MYRAKQNRVSIKKLSKFLNYDYDGEDFDIIQVSNIDNVKDHSLVFYTETINAKFQLKDNQKYNLKKLENHKNIVLISDANFKQKINIPIIYSKNPRLDFQRIIMEFFSEEEFKPGIHSTVTIEPNVKLGKNVYVGPNCYIGKNVIIGDNTKILSNTVIFGITKVGKNSVISSNCTIGSEGFSFSYDGTKFIHFNHIGEISIGDNVWIGSNCTVERSQIDKTIIEDHVKIDDLVHISHNTTIKKFSQITVGSMILGRAKIGEHCWISPNSVVENGCEIGDNSIVGTSSLVRNNFPSNSVIIGTPAKLVRTNK